MEGVAAKKWRHTVVAEELRVRLSRLVFFRNGLVMKEEEEN